MLDRREVCRSGASLSACEESYSVEAIAARTSSISSNSLVEQQDRFFFVGVCEPCDCVSSSFDECLLASEPLLDEPRRSGAACVALASMDGVADGMKTTSPS